VSRGFTVFVSLYDINCQRQMRLVQSQVIGLRVRSRVKMVYVRIMKAYGGRRIIGPVILKTLRTGDADLRF